MVPSSAHDQTFPKFSFWKIENPVGCRVRLGRSLGAFFNFILLTRGIRFLDFWALSKAFVFNMGESAKSSSSMSANKTLTVDSLAGDGGAISAYDWVARICNSFAISMWTDAILRWADASRPMAFWATSGFFKLSWSDFCCCSGVAMVCDIDWTWTFKVWPLQKTFLEHIQGCMVHCLRCGWGRWGQRWRPGPGTCRQKMAATWRRSILRGESQNQRIWRWWKHFKKIEFFFLKWTLHKYNQNKAATRAN